MNNIKRIGRRQHGLSFVGWMALVAIFGLLIVSLFKVFPMYSENFTIRSILDGLKDEQKIDFKSRRAVWDTIFKRLSVNNIYSIKRDHLKMERKNGKTTITIAYEVQHPYIANLYIVGKFSESVVIDR